MSNNIAAVGWYLTPWRSPVETLISRAFRIPHAPFLRFTLSPSFVCLGNPQFCDPQVSNSAI